MTNSNSSDVILKPTDSEKVDRFIAEQEKWKSQLEELRDIVCPRNPKKAVNEIVTETIKWGVPTYTVSGKIVISIGSFKNHYGLWFHQGVFLKDQHKVLINAQEGVTKAMRQWRFDENTKIDSKTIKLYVEEALANQLAGKELKPQHKPQEQKPELPADLTAAFKSNKAFKAAFQLLSPGKQKEYARHVGSAKQEKTRLSRIEKIRPMILGGAGLHDKYRSR